MPVLFEFTTKKGEPKFHCMTIRAARNGFSVTVDWENEGGGPMLKTDDFIFQDAKRLSQFVYGFLEKVSSGQFDPMNNSPDELFDNGDEVVVEEEKENESAENTGSAKGKRVKK